MDKERWSRRGKMSFPTLGRELSEGSRGDVFRSKTDFSCFTKKISRSQCSFHAASSCKWEKVSKSRGKNRLLVNW